MNSAPSAKGCDGNTFFASTVARTAFCAGIRSITLAHLPLFHRRLDGYLHTTRALVPVKIRCDSEQTLSVQRYMRAGSIVNAITVHILSVDASQPMAMLEHDATLHTRHGIERLMNRGRYSAERVSYTAPQPHPRALPKVLAQAITLARCRELRVTANTCDCEPDCSDQ